MEYLTADRRYDVGDVVLTERPLIRCRVDLKSAYKRFLMLTADELSILQRYRVLTESLSAERDMVINFLPKNHPNVDGLLWFLGILKCYGHGSSSGGQALWLLYPRANRAEHSCSPNTIYRNQGGELQYVAIKPIRLGEKITISYIGALYGSTNLRRQKLKASKLIECHCEKCDAPVDRARRVWCPHCRTKEEEGAGDPGFAVYCGTSEKINMPQLDAIRNMNKTSPTDGWWMCTKCKLPLADAVMPIQMEEMLTTLYDNLVLSLGIETPDKWMKYLVYLYRTAIMVLGPMHWLIGGAYFLFSKFYASAWKTHCTADPASAAQYVDLSISNGLKYVDFVEALYQDSDSSIVYTDIVPWVTVLMRLCLSTDNWSAFSKLAGMYVQKCNIVYGAADPMMQAFYQAVLSIHRFGSKSPLLHGAVADALARSKTEVRSELLEADPIVRSTTHLEKAFKPVIQPWRTSARPMTRPASSTTTRAGASYPAAGGSDLAAGGVYRPASGSYSAVMAGTTRSMIESYPAEAYPAAQSQPSYYSPQMTPQDLRASSGRSRVSSNASRVTRVSAAPSSLPPVSRQRAAVDGSSSKSKHHKESVDLARGTGLRAPQVMLTTSGGVNVARNTEHFASTTYLPQTSQYRSRGQGRQRRKHRSRTPPRHGDVITAP